MRLGASWKSTKRVIWQTHYGWSRGTRSARFRNRCELASVVVKAALKVIKKRVPCYAVRSHLATMGNTLSVENIVKEVRAEISRLQQVLSLLGGGNVETTARPTRQISAAGRRRIAAATRARWAKIRAEKAAGKVSGNSGVKPQRKVSAAARRKMAAAQRARWAKVRAAKKQS